MADFFELEKRCKRLKYKKLLPFSVAIVIAISATLFFLQKESTPQKKQKKIEKIAKQEVQETKKEIIIPEKEEMRVAPSLDVKEEKNEKPPVTTVLSPVLSLEKVAVRAEEVKEKPKKEEIKKETKTVTQKKESKNRLTVTKRPELSVSLEKATRFYESNEYEKALKWVKEAQKEDRENEDTWILFAKILYEKGEKEKALRVVETYLRFKPTSSIKELEKAWK